MPFPDRCRCETSQPATTTCMVSAGTVVLRCRLAPSALGPLEVATALPGRGLAAWGPAFIHLFHADRRNAMQFVPAPGIVALSAIFIAQTEPCENTFHYRVGGTIDIAKLTEIADTYIAWLQSDLSNWANDVRLQKVYVRDLTTQHSAVTEVNPVGSTVGTDASGPLPNNVSWALARRTGKSGRAFRGRVYLIGMTIGDLDTGAQTITPARANARVAFYDGLITAQQSDNAATEVILHRALGTGTDVIGYGYSDLYLDSQRRRLPGHNRHH